MPKRHSHTRYSLRARAHLYPRSTRACVGHVAGERGLHARHRALLCARSVSQACGCSLSALLKARVCAHERTRERACEGAHAHVPVRGNGLGAYACVSASVRAFALNGCARVLSRGCHSRIQVPMLLEILRSNALLLTNLNTPRLSKLSRLTPARPYACAQSKSPSLPEAAAFSVAVSALARGRARARACGCAHRYGKEADVWSFGGLLVHMATRVAPYALLLETTPPYALMQMVAMGEIRRALGSSGGGEAQLASQGNVEKG
eukprot:6210356-Pleurochrysis_carterae.AAC.2